MTVMSVVVKEIVAYLNYGHMHEFDNYYTKCTYLANILNKIYKNIKEIYMLVGNKTVWMFGSFGLCIEYMF